MWQICASTFLVLWEVSQFMYWRQTKLVDTLSRSDRLPRPSQKHKDIRIQLPAPCSSFAVWPILFLSGFSLWHHFTNGQCDWGRFPGISSTQRTPRREKWAILKLSYAGSERGGARASEGGVEGRAEKDGGGDLDLEAGAHCQGAPCSRLNFQIRKYFWILHQI